MAEAALAVKACPFCAEEIQEAARACVHCSRNLYVVAHSVRVERHRQGFLYWGLGILAVLVLVAFLRGALTL